MHPNGTVVPHFIHSIQSIPLQSGDILEDVRRLNVAVTRAKHKLVLIGMMSVLKAYAPLHDLIEMLHPEQVPCFCIVISVASRQCDCLNSEEYRILKLNL